MLTKRKKQKVIKELQRHEKDTGSAEVQVGVLSKRIDELAAHLKKHNKDQHSRRGLLQMVAKRRSHLNYIQKKDPKRYRAVTQKIGLSKTKKPKNK